MMPVLKILLFPFSLLYSAITGIRNHLYNIGWKRSFQFDRFVVSVGNLTVGGTGKTPFVELILRQFKSKYKLAVLSRGYGRRTKGFRLAGAKDDATTLGDEPFQYQVKYGSEVTVAVGEERALAIPEILKNYEQTELIVLDDAFQHRAVRADVNILLSDFQRPFYEDFVLPAGLLRESRRNAKRADFVVITKCPPLLDKTILQKIEKSVWKYSGEHKPVFFSSIKYLNPVKILGPGTMTDKVLLFSGIANPEPLEAYVKANYDLKGHLKFPDHHSYSDTDIRRLTKKFEQLNIPDLILMTTEKDMIRLLSQNEQFLHNYPVFYLPIELYFLKNEDSFAKMLNSKVDQWIRDKGIARNNVG